MCNSVFSDPHSVQLASQESRPAHISLLCTNVYPRTSSSCLKFPNLFFLSISIVNFLSSEGARGVFNFLIGFRWVCARRSKTRKGKQVGKRMEQSFRWEGFGQKVFFLYWEEKANSSCFPGLSFLLLFTYSQTKILHHLFHMFSH
jgi:hypothetical protein